MSPKEYWPWSPMMLEALLVCYWSANAPVELTQRGLGSIGKLNELRRRGLINSDNVVTGKGDCLVKAIMAVPMPVQRTEWTLPDDNSQN